MENTFGIMISKFRVLLGTLNVSVEMAKVITLACCVLHNFFSKKSASYLENETDSYQNGRRVDGNWRKRLRQDGVEGVRFQSLINPGRNGSLEDIRVRNFQKYKCACSERTRIFRSHS